MRAGSFYQNYREVKLLVVHCSATRCDKNFSVEALRRCHLARGFASIGYHFYITRDGEVHICRPVHQIGAHATGWNDKSIGICYEGGLDAHGHPADTRTDFQKHSLRVLVMLLLRDYPGSRLCGHRDLSPDLNGNGEIEPEEWIKECPCFDAAAIVREAAPPNPGCAG